MNIYSIPQLVTLAKFTSPIYQALYRDVAPDTPFEALPILTHDALMAIVHDEQPDFVFSDGNTHGIIFESSASTGKPKVTLFGRDEWESSTRLLAIQHWHETTIRDGDRIANLCASPYLSFRIVHSVIEQFPGRCSEIPIGCDLPFTDLNALIDKYRSNVLAGVSSTVLGLAVDLLDRGQTNKRIDRILAGGELLYGAQHDLIRRAFPHATMTSFMFGTTESGVIAYSALCDGLDTFRAMPGVSVVEVIDETTQQPINTPGQIGKCVVTSRLRVAAPALRIDTGDYVTWLDEAEAPARRFRLLGRKFPFQHEIDGATFSETEVWALIQALKDQVPITKLQLEIYPSHLEIVYACLPGLALGDPNARILDAAYRTLPSIHAASIPISARETPFAHFLETTRRKGRLVLDRRSAPLRAL